MADLKISQLSASSALAGTEVTPIVQGAATKKATIDQILSPAAGKGVNFVANTPAAGMTSQLLNWYEEGTWTPVVRDAASGTAATSSTSIGRYTKIGRMVQFQIQIENINTSGLTAGNTIFVTGFPFTISTMFTVATVLGDEIASTAGNLIALLYQGTTVCALYNGITTGLSGAKVSQITSGAGDLYITGVYQSN